MQGGWIEQFQNGIRSGSGHGEIRETLPFSTILWKRGARERGRINIHTGLRLLPKKRAEDARATNVGWGGDVTSYVSTGIVRLCVS